MAGRTPRRSDKTIQGQQRGGKLEPSFELPEQKKVLRWLFITGYLAVGVVVVPDEVADGAWIPVPEVGVEIIRGHEE